MKYDSMLKERYLYSVVLGKGKHLFKPCSLTVPFSVISYYHQLHRAELFIWRPITTRRDSYSHTLTQFFDDKLM